MGGQLMCVPVIDPTCIPDEIINRASQDILKTIAEQVGTFVTELIKIVVVGWLQLPSPKVAPSLDAALGGQTSGAVAHLRQSTWWLVTALAVGSLLVAAARIAWNRHGREAADLAKGVLHLVLLSGLGVPIVLLLTEIGDSYSDWIINKSTDGQFQQRVAKLFAISVVPGSPMRALGFIGIIIIGLILAATLAVQIMLLFGRAVGLVLLTGLLPVAAAGGMVGRNRHSRDRYVAWLLAFVLYKPVASTIYATGFWLIGEGTSVMDVMSGLMTFLIALVALPALMRLITPAVGLLADGAGSGAMQGFAVATMLGTGAVAAGGIIASSSRGAAQSGAARSSGAGSAALAFAGPPGIAASAATQTGAQVIGAVGEAAADVARTSASGAGADHARTSSGTGWPSIGNEVPRTSGSGTPSGTGWPGAGPSNPDAGSRR
jgi:hypothetical protein